MKGVMERLQRAYQKHNIQLFYKARYTIRNVVACSKDPQGPEEKCGMVYECKCEECGQLYVGEMERSLGDLPASQYRVKRCVADSLSFMRRLCNSSTAKGKHARIAQ